jgi:hypothetical protein
MKRTFLAATLVLLLASIGWAQNSKPDFSGTWNLDLGKSDFGPAPAPDSIVLVIVHKEPNIKVSSTQKGQQGNFTNERNLTTDGKENPNKIRSMDGEQDVKSTSQWSGPKLTTSYSLQAQGMQLAVKDSWELSGDGKVLTIARAITAPQGDEFVIKMVYNKQ